MNILICHAHDAAAQWLYLEALKYHLPLEKISPDQLILAKKWVQNLCTDTDDFEVTLTDGRCISSGQLGLIINRTQFVGLPQWKFAQKKEAAYAAEEISAALLSLLYAAANKTRMFNPPVPNSLSGSAYSEVQWKLMAVSLGIPILESQYPEEEGSVQGRTSGQQCICSILVVDGKTISNEKSKKLTDYAIQLSQCTGMPLLELFFQKFGNSYQFLRGNVLPDFRNYRSSIVPVLFRHLLQA